MKEITIMTKMIKIITKGMMATYTSTGMTTTTNVEDFKVEDNILEMRKINHVNPSSATHA